MSKSCAWLHQGRAFWTFFNYLAYCLHVESFSNVKSHHRKHGKDHELEHKSQENDITWVMHASIIEKYVHAHRKGTSNIRTIKMIFSSHVEQCHITIIQSLHESHGVKMLEISIIEVNPVLLSKDKKSLLGKQMSVVSKIKRENKAMLHKVLKKCFCSLK